MKDKRHAMIKRLKYRFSCLMLAALLLVAILPAGTVQAAGGSVTITTASLGSFKIGRDGVISALNAVGGTVPYTWSSTDLPAGLSVGNITGTISGRVYGTPTAAAGTYSVHITCTDSLGASDTKAFGLTVRSSSTTYTQMETTSTSASIQTLATGYVGAPYSQSIGADVTVSQLPPGLSYDASLGLLSGTPIAAESFQVGYKYSNSSRFFGTEYHCRRVFSRLQQYRQYKHQYQYDQSYSCPGCQHRLGQQDVRHFKRSLGRRLGRQ